MKKGLLSITFALVALTACNGGGNSSKVSTNSSSSNPTPSISQPSSTSSSTNSSTSTSSPVVQQTYISEAALNSIKGSIKLTGSYKIDAVRYGSDYDYVFEAIQVYDEDQYYCYQTMAGEVIADLNLFNDDGFAATRTLTEKNVVSEDLLEDKNGEYFLWEESFVNNLGSLETTDFVLQEDGKYSCVDVEAGIELGKLLIGTEEKMSKMTLVVKEDKVVKIDFVTERYMDSAVLYQDSGSFVVSDHGTAEVPEVTPRETTEDHRVLAAALAEIELNYTAKVEAEITPYGYETSTGEYTYYFEDECVYVDGGTEEESFGYYFDAGALYEYGVNNGESYFIGVTDGVFADLSFVAHNLSTFAAEMFTYVGEGVYKVTDEYAPIIGSLVSIDNYGEYSNEVTITLDENNKLSSIQYNFFVDGYSGGYGFYKYTFSNVGTTTAPISLDGLLEDIQVIKNIPSAITGKWYTSIQGKEVTIRISKSSVFIDTTQAMLISCDSSVLVVSVDDVLYELHFENNGTDTELNLVLQGETYELVKADDSKWNYQVIAEYVGSDIVPAFTSGDEYTFGYQELDDGSHIYAVEITGADCSTAWEDEYFIDLVVAGFIQDNSYSYEDGYGYIFAAPDSSCLVQFFYVPDVNTFVIYIYTA